MYRILVDPISGRFDPATLSGEVWGGALYFVGLATLLLECSAPLILTRWMPWWAVGGALMHLGIITTMCLGYFGWGMLSLYPLLLTPWILRRRES